jgi:hypothetical protein
MLHPPDCLGDKGAIRMAKDHPNVVPVAFELRRPATTW